MSLPEELAPGAIRRGFWFVPLPPERREIARRVSLMGLASCVLLVLMFGSSMVLVPAKNPESLSLLLVLGPVVGICLAGAVHFVGAWRGYRISLYGFLTIMVVITGPSWLVAKILPAFLPRVDKPAQQADSPNAPPAMKTMDEKLVKSLAAAFYNFHNGIISADKDERHKALAAWLATPADVKTLYSKYAMEAFYEPVLTANLDTDIEDTATTERNYGDIASIEAVDLRGGSAPDDLLSVIRTTPADAPLYLVRVQYKNETRTVTYGPIIKVNGRWAWMPGLEKMTPYFQEPSK